MLPRLANLFGPDFTRSAFQLTRNYRVGTINVLTVFPGMGTPMIGTLKPALTLLKPYFAIGARVVLCLPAFLVPASLLSELSAAAGVPVSLSTTTPLAEQQAMQQLQTQISTAARRG